MLIQERGHLLLSAEISDGCTDVSNLLTDSIPVIDSADESFSVGQRRSITKLAQRIQAGQYLRHGFISGDEIDEEGCFADEYSGRSTYILASGGDARTTCRLINCTDDGIMSLPTARHFSIDPAALREVAGIGRLSELGPDDVVEMSGLASERCGRDERQSLNSVWLGYSRAARISLEEGHKVWLMNTEQPLIRQLKALLGPDSITQIGDEHEYMGPATVPVSLNPQRVIRSLLEDESARAAKKKELLRTAFDGISDKNIDPDLVRLMRENGIGIREYAEKKRRRVNKRLLATAAIFAYSLGRALPAASVDGFHGSPRVLWGIDVATALPYSWGLIEAASASKASRRAAGATVAAGSFIAPYAYFWHEGRDYPSYVPIALGMMIGAAALKEAVQAKRRTRKERELEDGEKDLEAGLRRIS